MFEDSLVESQNRIHTKSRWFAIGSFLAQAGCSCCLFCIRSFIPSRYPGSQSNACSSSPPRRSHGACGGPRANIPASQNRTLPSLQTQPAAPSRIPNRIATIIDPGPQPPSGLMDIGGLSNGQGIPGWRSHSVPRPRPSPSRIHRLRSTRSPSLLESPPAHCSAPSGPSIRQSQRQPESRALWSSRLQSPARA